MNRTTPYGARYTGWFYDALTPAQKFYNRGTLVMTMSTNDTTFEGKIAAASPNAATGDTSSYAEGAITGILVGLDALGLITDSTTT